MIKIYDVIKHPYGCSSEQAHQILKQVKQSTRTVLIFDFNGIEIFTTQFVKTLIDNLTLRELQQAKFINMTKHGHDKLQLAIENRLIHHNLSIDQTNHAIFG